MADVLDFNGQAGKVTFKDDNLVTAITGGSGDLILIQQWNVTYNQQVNPLYECGTSTVYFSAKHQAGQLTVDRVVAERVSTMKDVLGEICSPQDPSVHVSGCNSEITMLTLKNCMLTGVTLSGNSQQGHVGENLTCTFVSLEE